MTGKWLRIIEASGEERIGAALVRLARQATAVHLHAAERGEPGGGAACGDRPDELSGVDAAALREEEAGR